MFLSDTEAKGGAAIAAARMARALAGAGMEVGMVVNDPQDGPPAGPWQRFVVRADLAVDWSLVPDADAEQQALHQFAAVLDTFSPDAVSIHNIHGGGKVGWSVDMVRRCAERVPTTWTLHDTWSFTGRCAYLNGCRMFPDQCGKACPTSDEYPFLSPDQIPGEYSRKLDVLRSAPMLAAVAPSAWMAQTAAWSGWRDRKIRIIPNCLDTSVYLPVDPVWAREELGINPDMEVILLCADDLNDPRKGTDLALRTLKMLHRPLTLLVMGCGGKSFPKPWRGAIRDLGFVSDPRRKAIVYSAADVMVHSALQDNLPNTVMESLACGTPVAGFAIGGISDMVVQGQTGFLSDEVSAEGLASALEKCLSNAPALERAARKHVEQSFSSVQIVARWLRVIGSLGRK